VPETIVAIHRFTARTADTEQLSMDTLRAHALTELNATCSEGQSMCSNIGGFHGARDLWQRPAVQSTSLPTLLEEAALRAATYEAEQLGRAPLSTRVSEAWFNALSPGGWNLLHTHPGAIYSGVLFLSGGAVLDDADAHDAAITEQALAGRLALIPCAPPSLSADHRLHVRPLPAASPVELQFLLLDPTPGTYIMFPSFVPHFVLPVAASFGNGAAPLAEAMVANVHTPTTLEAIELNAALSTSRARLSIALNFVDSGNATATHD